MELHLKIETPQQAELVSTLMTLWFNPRAFEAKVAEMTALVKAGRQATSSAVPEPTTSPVPPAARVKSPTPLEQAIAKLDETPTAAEIGNPTEKLAEPNADPFAALQAGTEPEAPAAEKPKKERKSKKTEAPAAEPEKAEDKPLTLDDIRKASTIALELIGAPVIQEALAKFEAIDQEKNALRMSALREADYGRYIDFLKKKVNDAAKEWPTS